MSQIRGRGRVVPRAAQAAVAAAAVASAEQQQQHLLLAPGHVSPAAHHLDNNKSPLSNKAGHAVVAVSSPPQTENSSDWRCAAYVVANSKPVQQLHASKLATGTGRQLLNSGQPLLVKQLQLAHGNLQQHPQQNSQATESAAAEQETRTAGNKSQLQLPVLCSPADHNRFMSADASKNIPGSYYHVRKPETSTVQLTFTDWLDCWQSWTTNRLLLQAHVCNWELSGTPTSLRVWPNKAVFPHLAQLVQVAPAAAVTSSSSSSSSNTAQPATLAAAQHVLDWALLAELLQAGQWASAGSLHLLAGGSDALLPARYDTQDRLLCQVTGRQRVLLLPPEQAFSGVYPYPVHHPYDGYSAVDWEEPEFYHWPAAAQVQGLLCDLSPGDTLLVPACWFMHSQLVQPACVSLQVQLTPQPSRLSSPPALLLQASRMTELWFGAETGPANVRRWFQALSVGREWQLLEPQLLTTKGYKLLHCCHMAMELLQNILALQHTSISSSSSKRCTATLLSSSDSSIRDGKQGDSTDGAPAAAVASRGLEAAARQYVASMCNGRLVPTTWLNEGISDPLYLQHPPQYHLIEEDAEAARYSSLFKHQLIENRPDWMDHATPLQLGPPGSGRSLIKAAHAAQVPALPPVKEE